MESPRLKKTALDRFMQMVSVALVLLVLSSVLSNVNLAEQSSPRTSQTRVLRPTPSPVAAQQVLAAGQPALAQPGQTSSETNAGSGLLQSIQVEPRAGSWPTWVLTSGRQIALPAPPGAQATAGELSVVRDLAAQRDPQTRAAIQYWDSGSPSSRWVEIALQLLQEQEPSLRNANQALAMLNVAVYESMVSVWHAKYTYNRLRPAQLDPDLAAIAIPASPSYPDEHAAAAGAASAILSLLYPDHAQGLSDMAQQAAQTRLQAGVAFPSDVETGLSLGRRVAERVMAYAGIDDLSPAGSYIALWWNAPPPSEPLSPEWRPWTLSYAGQLMPAAPSAASADATREALTNLQNGHAGAGRDERSKVAYWGSFEGTHTYWYELAAEKMAQYHLDTNPPLAARIYALLSVAHDDASNACWEALDTYGVMRPSVATSPEAPLLASPSLYSYPSLHGCLSGSMATVMAAVFPLDAQTVRRGGDETANAGLWVSGALPDDIQAGVWLGARSVALHVLSHPLPWLWGGE